jgi:hypothetical protein
MKMKYFLLLAFFMAAGNPAFAGPLFDKFRETQQQYLTDFGNQYLQEVGEHVFYPFGGPDVTYPLLMFPNFEVLTLMGLEPAKPVETYPVALDNSALSNLSSLYKRSFFITDQMASGLRNVAALILKQLENLGASDVTVQAIEGRSNAVEIKFTYNGKARTIRYYKAGLDNKQIEKNLDLLKTLKPFDVVLFKAASYLPHQQKFSTFRSFMLENAKTFVQDSTGIPYKYLKDHFKLDLHGQYLKPYKFPGGFEQVNFRKYSEELNNKKLNIRFGYGGGFVPTNILIATRKKDVAL